MNDKTLVERMTETINLWYEDEDYDEWWIYQRDYLEARNTIEAQATRIEALEAALRNIKTEAGREKGSWAHLKRVILLKCKQALENSDGR